MGVCSIFLRSEAQIVLVFVQRDCIPSVRCGVVLGRRKPQFHFHVLLADSNCYIVGMCSAQRLPGDHARKRGVCYCQQGAHQLVMLKTVLYRWQGLCIMCGPVQVPFLQDLQLTRCLLVVLDVWLDITTGTCFRSCAWHWRHLE